jgi:hypothetical protein
MNSRTNGGSQIQLWLQHELSIVWGSLFVMDLTECHIFSNLICTVCGSVLNRKKLVHGYNPSCKGSLLILMFSSYAIIYYDCWFLWEYTQFSFSRTERNADGSHSGRLLGSQRDSSRDIAHQDVDKCHSNQQKLSAATLSLRRSTKKDETEKSKELPPILKYIKTQVRPNYVA